MTLVELIATLPIMIAVSVVMAAFFPGLLMDTPKIQRATHVHRGLTHVLRTVQTDMDAAVALPESFGERTAGASVLLIRLPEGVVSYEVSGDKIVRNELTTGADERSPQTRNWSLPHARMKFQFWRRDGEVHAVAVYTAVGLRTRGDSEDKLANTRVYFLAALPSIREKT
jgi:type II secretory pathway pseudopilin PulG